jgi:hypothetical protein
MTENGMSGTYSILGAEEKCVQNLGSKVSGVRPLGRPRCRWEDNVTMDLVEIRLKGVNLIHLSHDRGHWLAVMNKVFQRVSM